MIQIIAAVGKNFELGKKNKLLWNLPADLKHFRDATAGKTIVMGRKTFESIGRPLPNRRNIILTRDQNFSAKNAEIVFHPEKIPTDDFFVIGGAEIYKIFLPKAEKLILTFVDAAFPDADAFFPKIDFQKWKKISEKKILKNPENEFDFRICEFEKNA